MIPPNDIERRLRATLDAHARNAPPGAPLADRILVELEAPVLRPRRGWRTWTSPLLAAAAIAAAALALVGVGNAHFGAAPGPAATHAVSHQPTPVQSVTQSAAPTSPSPTIAAPFDVTTANTGGVHGFRASDITFDSQTEGWALGSSNCLNGDPGRCTEILHTTDGVNWLAAPKGENFNVPGVQGCPRAGGLCVSNLRFANSSIGYAYGPDVLFMTTDGGAHWTRQPGLGADALETLDGNVILVRASNAPSLLFRRAPIGTSAWSSFSVPGFPNVAVGGTVQLSRAAGVAVLAVTDYNPAKGIGTSSAVFRSTDSGATWTRMVRPCGRPPLGYHVSISAATVAAGDGSMAVDCATQTAKDLDGFGETYSAAPGSTDFVAPASGAVVPPAPLIASPSRPIQLVVRPGGLVYRSVDTGNSWSRVPQLRGATYLGFASATVGRALGDGGRAIWTTHDAGATWSAVVFPA